MVYWLWDGEQWNNIHGAFHSDCTPYMFVTSTGERIEIAKYDIMLRAPTKPPKDGVTLYIIYTKP